MKIFSSYFSLILFVNFSGAMVPSRHSRDISHVLEDQFDAKKFESYKQFLAHPSLSFNCPIVPAQEPYYANMVLVKEVEILQETSQITPLLNVLLQRCALLASSPFKDEWTARFHSMLNFIVSAAAEKKAESSVAKLRQELDRVSAEKESWAQAAATRKILHEDALLNLQKMRAQSEQKLNALEEERQLLLAQDEKRAQQLADIGYKLYESELQKAALDATNGVLARQLARAQRECDHLKEEAHKKSCENGRLRSKLRNGQYKK